MTPNNTQESSWFYDRNAEQRSGQGLVGLWLLGLVVKGNMGKVFPMAVQSLDCSGEGKSKKKEAPKRKRQ